MSSLDMAERVLGRVMQRPGDEGYLAATKPRNLTARQEPVAVVAAREWGDVTRAVQVAAEMGLRVMVQATGHGAAGTMAEDILLIDTSRLSSVTIDASTRTARVGAGAAWSVINAAAQRHGLLGLAGTAPDVGAAGYTLFGGIGWLTRRHGMASASLRRVEFVDGGGEVRVADDEHLADALWACRGGGGVGIVTSLTMDLVPVDDLWAGYQLWPVAQAEPVVAAWAAAVIGLDDTVTSAIGFLSAPHAPTIPASLRGRRVVHMSAASLSGVKGLAPLRDALAGAPHPAIDTFAACDAQRLATIHLDPPGPVPAVGDGRWLTASAPAHALNILAAVGFDDEAALAEIEIRHTATRAGVGVDGALTVPPGPFLLHAVGAAPSADDRPAVQRALDEVRAAASSVDTGRASASFCDGQITAPSALPDDTRHRLETLRRQFDPRELFRYARAV